MSAFRFDEAHYENRNIITTDDDDADHGEENKAQEEENDESSSSDEDDHYFRQQPAESGKNTISKEVSEMVESAQKNPPPPPPGRPAKKKQNYSPKKSRGAASATSSSSHHHDDATDSSKNNKQRRPSLEPYLTRLEKFELFSTHQCYYLVACDKHCTGYRIMKMDRTLIERPKGGSSNSSSSVGGGGGNKSGGAPTPTAPTTVPTNNSMTDSSTIDRPQQQQDPNNAYDESTITEEKNKAGTMSSSPSKQPPPPPPPPPPTQQQQQSQSNQQTFRRLSEFVFEDPAVYTQSEIKDILDMINDGNRNGMGGGGGGGGTTADDHHQHFYGGSGSGSRDYDASSSYGGDNGGGDHSIHRTGSSMSMRPTAGGGGGGGGNNTGGGGLKPICKAYGVLGFIRFLDCYYLSLITKRAKVGSIGGNSIYTIKSTETFPLKPAERADSSSSASENAGHDPLGILSMWQRGKRSVGLGLTNREIAELRYQGLYQVVDLNKNFFFSYTYDLTRSLQENFLAMTSKPYPPPPFKDMYAWNFFLTRELEECTNSLTNFGWILPVVHGAFIQRKLHDYGRSLNLMLLARRSRHFAGTRYLKRGVSDRGKVANDVEHEQIIHDETTTEGVFSSYLQIRGSIPTFWTQESSVTMPKPPIVLNRVDPTYQATQAHFDDLLRRYGSPIIVVDLVKQSEKREREVIVGNEFRNAIDYINCHIDDQHKILYCALDYSHISKHRNLNVSSSLNDVATWSVNQTGFFCSYPQWKIVEGGSIEPFDEDYHQHLSKRLGVPFFPMEQIGILRTNCIDCLDRTNVAQFSSGVEALGQQLVVMGIRSSPKLDPSSIIVRMLIDMYVEIGDQIALQYGGSEAHKKVASAGEKTNVPGQLGKHKELLTSIRRYYSNAFTDRLKQDAMNLFLGYYVPSQNSLPLWELDNDYYLHNFHVNAGRGALQSMKSYESMFGVDWNDNENDNTIDHDKQADERGRIDIVKQRCEAQNNALSQWWKVAIQAYIQQRMWMKLDPKTSSVKRQSRFDQFNHTHELTHFDKFFARPWALPSRLSHEDQHKTSLDGEMGNLTSPRRASAKEVKLTLFDERVQSSKGNNDEDKNDEKKEDDCITLQEFVRVHGFSSKSKSSLSQLIESHRQNSYEDDMTLSYLGSLKEKTSPCPKYLDYASPGTMPRRGFRPGAREEFVSCLRDTNLDSNDVQGIRKLSESAHIGQEIKSGPYRGLNQNESAVKVASEIYGIFNNLEEKIEEGELSYSDPNPPEVFQRFHQSGLDAVGVKETFKAGWNHLGKAEKTFTEITDMSSVGYKRSDITTESSMKLYASFFDSSSEIRPLEQAYTLGQRLPNDPTKPLRRSTRPCGKVSGQGSDLKSFDEGNFIMKAAARGINIRKSTSSNSGKADVDVLKLNTRPIPAGFEQINEDLFARKDNKFMVFNGPGVDSFSTNAVTKTQVPNFFQGKL